MAVIPCRILVKRLIHQRLLHFSGTTYRTREEIQNMRSKNDPIMGLKNRILEQSIATEEELKQIDKQVRTEIDDAVIEAKASPQPPMTELYTDIYVKGTEPKSVRGCTADDIHYY